LSSRVHADCHGNNQRWAYREASYPDEIPSAMQQRSIEKIDCIIYGRFLQKFGAAVPHQTLQLSSNPIFIFRRLFSHVRTLAEGGQRRPALLPPPCQIEGGGSIILPHIWTSSARYSVRGCLLLTQSGCWSHERPTVLGQDCLRLMCPNTPSIYCHCSCDTSPLSGWIIFTSLLNCSSLTQI